MTVDQKCFLADCWPIIFPDWPMFQRFLDHSWPILFPNGCWSILFPRYVIILFIKWGTKAKGYYVLLHKIAARTHLQTPLKTYLLNETVQHKTEHKLDTWYFELFSTFISIVTQLSYIIPWVQTLTPKLALHNVILI